MESTNNPDQGTGYTVAEAATNIESLLDTDNGTTEEVDADEGAVEAQNTEVEQVDDDEVEQSDEDSEGVETDEDSEGEAEETESADSTEYADDHLVTIDGEQITWAELKKQRMLHADYTRKRQQETAELKQHMNRYQVQQVEMADMRAAVANDVNEMKKRIYLSLGDNLTPPTKELYDADPYEYGRQKIEFEQKSAALQELHMLESQKAKQDAMFAEDQFKIKQAEALEQFSSKHAEFADKQKAPALLGELGTFLSNNGFCREEIEGIADSRIMDIVYRLYKAETIAKQAPKVVKELEKLPKLAMPGTVKSTPSVNSDFHKEAQRYKRSGNFNDAVSAISKLL